MKLIIVGIVFLSVQLLSESAILRRKRQADPLKDQLLDRAKYLLERAQQEISALRAANRAADITALQREEQALQQLVTQLNGATSQTQIRQIEQNLNEAENRLEQELNRLELQVINTAAREAIIARAEALEARAASEIAKLRAEDRAPLAAQLQFEEAIIAELVRELRAARTGSQILQLERQLRSLEDRVETELNSITHTVADAEKDDLIKQADALNKNISVEIDKLKADGRSQEADTLASDQRLLTELVTELKKETVAAEVTRIKAALKENIARIQAAIKKFESTPATDPERDALLKRSEDLKNRAQTQIYKLKGAGKDSEAATLDAEIKLIDELVNQLPKATDAAETKRIKDSLKSTLDTLEAQLKVLESQIIDAERDNLVKRAEDLKNKTQIELNALNEAGRQAEASALDAEQKLVDELVTEAKKANDAAELTRVKTGLKAALDKLEADLKKLESPFSDAEADALIKRANDLKASVTAESIKQRSAGQLASAAQLEAEQNLVDELVTQLKKATNQNDANRLKTSLKTNLDKLEADLKKLQETPAADPERDALLKRADELKTRADADVTKLKSANRAAEADNIQTKEKLIDELANQLKKATTPAELTRLKDSLKQSLDSLEADLKKAEAAPEADPEKDALLKRADDTLAKVKDADSKLKAANQPDIANTLELEQKLITELVAQLKKTTTSDESKPLKSVLKDSLDQVDAQLKRVEQVLATDPEKDALAKRADELNTKAQATVTKLRADGRAPEASALEAQNKLANELAAEVKRTTPASTDLPRLKTDLKAALDKLEADIKEAEKPVTNEELKQQLIKTADDLAKKAADAIAKLKADGRPDDTATLDKQSQALKTLSDDLKKTTTAAELKPLEQKLADQEKAVNAELERVAKPVVNKQQVADLTKRIESVALKAKDGVKRLQDSGSTADGLAFEVQLLVVLDVVLQAADTPAQVTAVSQRLDQIEKSVDEQLSQIPK